ncbi:MAG: hypothetical protein JKY54_07200 [Flavobacteriales bacterium]|nr:hypothetical protein [Flavobacteriales bacterium]
MKQETSIAPQEKTGTSTAVVHRERQSWWQSLSEKQRNIIMSLAITLGISVAALVAIKFGVGLVRGAIANKQQGKSFGKDRYTTWAKQFKNAFDNNGWWGTDEQVLRKTLRDIPSQEDFQKVQTAYRKLYEGSNLIEDMTDELKTTEYNEMLAIISAKPLKAKDAKEGPIYDPHGWAKRFKAAFDYAWLGFGWGTDEDAINAVITEMLSQQAFIDTATIYQKEYGAELIATLKDELSVEDFLALSKKVMKKPKN